VTDKPQTREQSAAARSRKLHAGRVARAANPEAGLRVAWGWVRAVLKDATPARRDVIARQVTQALASIASGEQDRIVRGSRD
jgi:hypothetical protein